MKRAFQDIYSATMFPTLRHQSPPHSAATHHPTTTSDQEADNIPQSNPTNDQEPPAALPVRPRGRPPGSKNKPKPTPPPVTVIRERLPFSDNPCMPPNVIEVCSGSDIVAAVQRFGSNWKTGLRVSAGFGWVCNVSLGDPTNPIVLHGCYRLTSMAAIIPPPLSPSTFLTPYVNYDALWKFVVTLGDPRTAQAYSGVVVRKLIASGTVHIVAEIFNNQLNRCIPADQDCHHMLMMRRNFGYSITGQPMQQSSPASLESNSTDDRHPANIGTYETIFIT